MCSRPGFVDCLQMTLKLAKYVLQPFARPVHAHLRHTEGNMVPQGKGSLQLMITDRKTMSDLRAASCIAQDKCRPPTTLSAESMSS